MPVTLLLFAMYRPAKAGVIAMLGGMLLLPEVVAFDAPLIPPLGKHEVTALCTFIGCLAFGGGTLRRGKLRGGVGWLVLALLASSVVTVMTNPETLVDGPMVRPGMTFRDAPAAAVRDALGVVLPFWLGRALIDSRRELRWLMKAMAVAGILYSLLILFEVRMSPRLHQGLYGFHARSDFMQTKRWGGWRPTVFMEHGLAIGVFALAAATCAAVNSRVMKRLWGLPAWAWACYLAVVLVLCRSTGAIMLALVLVPVAAWSRPQRQLRIASILAVLCLVYPLSKVTSTFPSDTIVSIATSLTDADRAASLEFRYANDDALVSRASEKLWFGWGGNGRNQVYNRDGRMTSVTDGHWIILLGTRGVIGLFCTFAVLLFPVFAARRRLGLLDDRGGRLHVAALSLVVVAYVFDLLPNGLFTTIPFFYAGALERLGRALPAEERAEAEAAANDDLEPEPVGGVWAAPQPR